MKWFLDENLSPIVGKALALHFLHDQYTSAHAKPGRYRAVDDVALLSMIARDGFDGFVTLDRNQLRVPEERLSIRETGLHWVGIRQPQGRDGIIFTTASLIAGMPYVHEAISMLDKPVTATINQVLRRSSQRLRLVNLETGEAMPHPAESPPTATPGDNASV